MYHLSLIHIFSVCSCQAGEGDAPDRLTVVFEVRGEGTAWLAGRREGQSLDVMGLLGNGFPMKREGRYLLVGGGIGVPPMLGLSLIHISPPQSPTGTAERPA